jgi:dihydropteroate synthase
VTRTRTHYLRPIPCFGFDYSRYDPEKAEVIETIAGQPRTGFAHLELITRHGAAPPSVVLMPCWGQSGFNTQDWHHPPFDGNQLWETFEAIIAPRPDFAGLSMDRPRIMGIVNVTPDSFSDGGRLKSVDAAVDHALRLAEEGADILDIGGESTRPGSDAVAVDEELRRVIPVVKALRSKTKAKISVDTRKSDVMRQAADAGADILNDVSAFTHDPAALGVAAKTGLPVMLMHAQGDPKTMNDDPQYYDAVLDVFDFLESRIDACVSAGIAKSKIVADPGIGFGKHLHHNVAVLSSMSLYHGLGVPVLLGASRKKLIGQLCNADSPADRVPGSLAAALSSVAQGVQIIRVHDVAATRQALSIWRAAVSGSEKELG